MQLFFLTSIDKNKFGFQIGREAMSVSFNKYQHANPETLQNAIRTLQVEFAHQGGKARDAIESRTLYNIKLANSIKSAYIVYDVPKNIIQSMDTVHIYHSKTIPKAVAELETLRKKQNFSSEERLKVEELEKIALSLHEEIDLLYQFTLKDIISELPVAKTIRN